MKFPCPAWCPRALVQSTVIYGTWRPWKKAMHLVSYFKGISWKLNRFWWFKDIACNGKRRYPLQNFTCLLNGTLLYWLQNWPDPLQDFPLILFMFQFFVIIDLFFREKVNDASLWPFQPLPGLIWRLSGLNILYSLSPVKVRLGRIRNPPPLG